MRVGFAALALVCSLAVTTPASAGYIATDAVVASVSNTSGNGPAFAVTLQGGSGACANSLVFFQEHNAGSKDVFKRAFAVSLTALATGSTVDVYSYSGDDCFTPAYITIKK